MREEDLRGSSKPCKGACLVPFRVTENWALPSVTGGISMDVNNLLNNTQFQTNSNEILQYLLQDYKINIDAVRHEIQMKKDAEYLAMHPYNIWAGANGYWYTIFEGDVKRKRRNKEDLERFIIDYYKNQSFFTIKDAFDDWLSVKAQTGLKQQSVTRYSDRIKHFTLENKYAEHILKKRFKDITEDDLDGFIYETAINDVQNGKEFKEFVSHVRNMLKYAKRKKYISSAFTSYFEELDLDTIKFSKKAHTKEEMTFSEDEELLLVTEMLKKCDIRSLGLIILFDTGLRVSELSAIKVSDVHDDYIHICRTEINYDDENGHNVVTVQDIPKTDNGVRDVYLTELGIYAVGRLLKLSEDNIWLFTDKGNRIKSHSFRKKLYGLCKAVNIPVRSPHKIRHAYATKLAYAGVVDDIKKVLMGHSDIRTTQSYVRDVVPPEVFRKEVSKLSKFKGTDKGTLRNVI